MSVQPVPSPSVLPVRVVRADPPVVRAIGCRYRDGGWAEHHDRLCRVETDPGELLDLMELAVTWHELDWSAAAVVPPSRWSDFAEQHTWRDPEWAERLFALATDVALRPAGPIPARAVDAVGW